MNQVILTGRITKEIELKQTASGKYISRFTIAVDRRKRDETDFINCVAFDRMAESLNLYVNKLTKIIVIGHIQTNNYQGKDGKTVFTVDVIVDSWEFCESRKIQHTKESTERENDESNGAMNEVGEEEELPF